MGLKYYADMNDEPVTDLLRQASIKTDNHLMDFSDSIWKYFLDTGIITVEYMIFYKGGPIDHGTHVPGPVAQLQCSMQCRNGFSTFQKVDSWMFEQGYIQS